MYVCMDWVTIRNCGYLYTGDNITDGTGMRNTRSFLDGISEEFPKLCSKYFNQEQSSIISSILRMGYWII